MPKFFIDVNFQYNGKIFRTTDDGSATLAISASDLKKEIAKGKHPKTGNWLSPVLNHCTPADNETRKIVFPDAEEIDEEIAEDPTNELEQIKAEFDRLGKAYDNRWGIDRFRNELKKARKESPNA